jgi:DNA-binding FadR family transcriptional regulator
VSQNNLAPMEEASGSGFDRVLGFLRDQLLNGAIRPGDRLAPERELSLRLGVSRPVLREALRALAMIGVVEIRHGVGTVVRRSDLSALGDFFAFALAQRPELVNDVIEARVAIECQAIRLACTRATLDDLERLRAALDRIDDTIEDPESGSEADYEFHIALVRASRSETLLCLYLAMTDLMRRSHRDRRELVRRYPELRSTVAADHERIFAAVVAHDQAEADRALRRHFTIGDEHRKAALTAPPLTTKGTISP